MQIETNPVRSQNPTTAQRYLDGLASLPPAPLLVSKLLALFQDPNHDVDQVVQLITYEPTLTAQILRMCKSAYIACEVPPGDIFEAISRIGFYQVYCLVVTLFGSKTKSMKGAEKGVDVEKLWRHSVTVAVSSSLLAEQAGQSKALVFTAGLLHDIGKLVLASRERESYAQLIQKAGEQGALLSNLERGAFATDHAELGGELMRRWELPPEIVTAVRSHHELENARSYVRLIAAVQIGDMVAHHLCDEDLAHTDLLTPCNAAFETIRLNPNDFDDLLTKTKSEMEKVKGMLEI